MVAPGVALSVVLSPPPCVLAGPDGENVVPVSLSVVVGVVVVVVVVMVVVVVVVVVVVDAASSDSLLVSPSPSGTAVVCTLLSSSSGMNCVLRSSLGVVVVVTPSSVSFTPYICI